MTSLIRFTRLLACVAVGGTLGIVSASPALALEVPFQKYALPNGLTVILHEDHALPLATVNIVYRVGSRYEEKGRTGFAHLFEHLMFMGTRRAPTKMFDSWMETEGGWNNAWTSEDQTDYYDVAPAHALPLLLWLEADRLSALGNEMTLDKLNAQRDVVRNERRQTAENQPYGKVELRLPELLFPPDSPYHHPVIGSHEDLQAATVDDVKSFFGRWYVPSNASMVVAGDFDPAATRALIEREFGWIASHAPPQAPSVTPARLERVVRETIEDNVQLPKVVMAWPSPARYAPGDAELDLARVILDEGKSSRLFKALVYDHDLAQEVKVSQNSRDAGSDFEVEAIARPNVTLDQLEAAIDAELKKLASEPVPAEELTRAKNQFETEFVQRLESLAERAMLLNLYQATRGDPGYAERDLQRYRDVTAAALQAAVKSTVRPDARVVLHIVPKPEAPAAEGGAK
jgi:zinc protease